MMNNLRLVSVSQVTNFRTVPIREKKLGNHLQSFIEIRKAFTSISLPSTIVLRMTHPIHIVDLGKNENRYIRRYPSL